MTTRVTLRCSCLLPLLRQPLQRALCAADVRVLLCAIVCVLVRLLWLGGAGGVH